MASPAIPSLLLPTGAPIPQLGFGTFKVDPAQTQDVVASAIDLGYRHIDTAQMYQNEAGVGHAWAESGIPREDFFLTTKLDNGNHEVGPARDSIARSLDLLQTDYVDLLLIHWPLPTLYDGDLLMPWRVLEEVYADGRARAIGLSNFLIHHLQVILDGCEVMPMVNQVEAHPYLPANELRSFARGHGIVMQAWSPLARGGVVTDPALIEIGQRYGVTAAQVALRWAIQRGDIVFPKSLTPKRQAENLRLFNWELSAEDMAAVDSLDRGEAGRTGSHPDVMNRL